MEHKTPSVYLYSCSNSMANTEMSLSPSLSGGGPHRGRYTQSSMGGIPPTRNSAMNSANSRFSPYSRPSNQRIIPVLPVQRDGRSSSMNRSCLGGEGEDFFAGCCGLGSVTSTAKKIMDTLASMSTPVSNARRVRIDSIKPVKPIGIGLSALMSSGTCLYSRNKFSGPPESLNPFLLPKSFSGFQPDPKESIPSKMIDCGTNTDNEATTRSELKETEVMKINVPPPPIVRRKSFSGIIIMPEKAQSSLADLIAKCKPVNGEYKFDKPWSLSDVDKYLMSDECKKDVDVDPKTTSDTTPDDVHVGDKCENEDSNTMSKLCIQFLTAENNLDVIQIQNFKKTISFSTHPRKLNSPQKESD